MTALVAGKKPVILVKSPGFFQNDDTYQRPHFSLAKVLVGEESEGLSWLGRKGSSGMENGGRRHGEIITVQYFTVLAILR